MKWMVSLIISFICAGMAQVSFKMIPESDIKIYLLFCYGAAFFIAGLNILNKKNVIKRNEIFLGIVLGLASVIQAFFCIMALQGLNGSIVFPVLNIGTIGLVTVISVGVLKEKISIRGITGIILGLISIIVLVT
jgi:drug/metabolite transporter (DMT)-like permease